ncbi:MAG: site-specific DNA-methyltransferase [Chthonomonas sp.]|nr:site-specific DNA-methyltransferase [Chthonomonas sp.]
MLDRVADESVDLIYIDPPFNSARQYNLLFKQVRGDPSPAQIMAFEDTWKWDPTAMEEFQQTCDHPRLRRLLDVLYDLIGESEMMAYLVAMAPRILSLSYKLKTTGSFYLHCDPAASHYLKLVCDLVFRAQNFRNEIVWKRQSAHSDAKLKFANVSDTILFYGKSDRVKFRPVFCPHDPDYVRSFYRHDDHDGRGKYQLADMSAPAGGGMAAINKATGLPNGWYKYKGFDPPPRGWRYSLETMEKLDIAGRIHIPKLLDGRPDTKKRLRLKRYLEELQGQVVSNIWSDIPPLQSAGRSGEARGYPTQKPVALMERIIEASSDEGDVVLDAFCGCGTTVSAAQKLKRKWIGIDVTFLAINEIEERLMEEFGLEKGTDFRVEGLPADLDAAREFFNLTRKDSHKQFEMWAVGLVNGQPREKKGGDRGIDGDLWLESTIHDTSIAPIQVKGGGLNPSIVRDFAHVIEREKAPIGALITLERPTRGMEQEALSLGTVESAGRKVPRLQMLPIEQLLQKEVGLAVPDGYYIRPSRYRIQGKLRI